MLAALHVALPIAIGMILATLPILAAPLILAARSDLRALLGFLAGWMLGFLALGALVIGFVDLTMRAPAAPAPWVVWLRLALGLLLIGFAWRKWRNRPLAGEAELPRWLAAFETIGAGRALALAFLLVVVNPKNAVLVASGALAIASATYAPLAQAGAMLVFTLVASLGIAAPLILRLALGDAATRPLALLKSTIARHSGLILALVLLAIGSMVSLGAILEIMGGRI